MLVSPVLAPVWIAGLVALLRRPRLRRFRFFAVAWVALVLVFLVTGGKPYYLAGMFPVLLGAGAVECEAWIERRSPRLRRAALATAIGLSAVVSAVIALPLLPPRHAGPVIAINPDVGETIGWPQFARTVAGVYDHAHGRPVLFTSNYGEAGALDRYGPALGLPNVYSGHNAFAEWGPPPNDPRAVTVVGVDASQLHDEFTGCHLAARVGNAAHVDNNERGTPIDLCSATRRPWSRLWTSLRHLG